MKHFVELSNDCIIQYKFIENKIDGKPELIADTGKAKGRHSVDGVTMLVRDYDQNGYTTGKLIEVWISKSDILTLSQKINHIDAAVDVTGIPNDDLPF